MKKYIFLTFSVLIIFRAFAYDIFEKVNTYEDLKKEVKSLPFEEKLKVDVLGNIYSGNEKGAKSAFLFFEILKTSYKDNPVLENVIYVPNGKYAVVVSKKRQEFKIITNKNGYIQEVYQENCITGKKPGDKLKEGDQRTPSGIYFPKSFISPRKLSEIYGHGAFPLNYPNIIDRLIFHKTGDGIWLHATNNDNRPPFSSNGCVVVKNSIFDYISKYLIFKETPIIIVEDYSFTTKEKLTKDKKDIARFLYDWIKAWESTTTSAGLRKYFSFYSEDMVSTYGDKKAFIKHKKRVSKRKKWIKIYIDNVYISKDGRVLNFGNIYAVSFDMKYKSNNYNWEGKKIIYLVKEKGTWKILAEESL